MWHIWTLDDWEKNIDLERSGHRCGLRLRFDKEVDSEVRRACNHGSGMTASGYGSTITVPPIRPFSSIDGGWKYYMERMNAE